ncbi:hypothetical protein PPSIR1_40964 [Plesiocystis pacifica SIR-1]|uniref:NodB homology domain-containing protein n=1 Tax=Plesiocystis pacifica SIR-1 TaxID=391625 RepID=A6GG01_9BACT|nr:polysaccharide deacetylase family protein [Plesiocystis pacifica]EDM75188.1 hypothetical protein PPSIR1_40964 [Plesiocystis pacifica SIR-1]
MIRPGADLLEGRRAAILMVHRVTPRRATAFGLPDAWRVRGTALTFDELLAWVGDRPVLPLQRFVEAAASRLEPPPGVALTFDDGYAEWLEVGAALAERRWPATFCCSQAMSADGELHPVDAYYDLLDRAQRRRLELTLPDGRELSAALDSVAAKRALVVGGPKPFVTNPDSAAQTLAAVAEALGAELRPRLAATLYLGANQRRALVAMGHTLGGHGLRHLRLTDLDDAALEREVCGSRRWLGEGASTFAYPDGAHDARVVAAVRDAGFVAGLTCDPGRLADAPSALELPRVFARPI